MTNTPNRQWTRFCATAVVLATVASLSGADPIPDERVTRDTNFAERSISAFLTYRVVTGDKSCDAIIREYEHLLCGGVQNSESLIDTIPVEKLLPLDHWSSAFRIGCGCFLVNRATITISAQTGSPVLNSRVVIAFSALLGALGCTSSEPTRVDSARRITSTTLLATLYHRARYSTTAFDPVIRQMLALLCSPEEHVALAKLEIERVFPIARLGDAEAADCGYLVVRGARLYGDWKAGSSAAR